MTPDAVFSLARKALLAVVIPVALFVAVVAQVTVVNRLPLPDSVVPDLVLLLVTAVAVSTTPVTGSIVGFAGGLALDVAPPATHDAGEYALVFCLVCYAAARLSGAMADATGERDPIAALAIMATAAACGETGKAALGLLLSDRHVTSLAIGRVLPGAVLADLLLSPFVLWLVRLAARRREPERAPRPEFTRAQRRASALRPASAGAAPHLRLVGTGTLPPAPRPPRREPRLRLAGARSPALAAQNAVSSPVALPLLAGGRATRLNFAGSGASFLTGGGALGPSLFPGPAGGSGRAMPPKGWLRPSRPAAKPARSGSPPKGWLRPSRPAAKSARSGSPPKGWLRAAKPSELTRPAGSVRPAGPARAINFSKTPSAAGLAGRRPVRRHSGPPRGWLRTSSLAPEPVRRARPRKGWARTSRPSLRTWRRSAPPGSAVPSGRWLRRARARNRWRVRRNWPLSRVKNLLPMGGGRR